MLSCTRHFSTLISIFVLWGCAVSDRVVKNDIAEIRSLVKQRGSEQTKDYDLQFYDVALPRKWPAAFLFTSSEEGSTVYISAGIRRLMQELAEISIVAQDAPSVFGVCRALYTEHIRQRRSKVYRSKNMSAYNVVNGYDADVLVKAGPFFAETKSVCNKYSDRFPIDKTLHTQRDAIAKSIVQFVYFHETAHLIFKNGDPGTRYGLKSKEERRATLKISRKLEIDADNFAVARWVELHDDPMHLIDGTAFIDWNRVIGGTRCKRDRDRTHTSGDVRAMIAIKSMRDLANKAGKSDSDPERKKRIDKFIRITEINMKTQSCPQF